MLNTIPISIIIPTLNRGSILIDTLDNLLNINPKPYEIIIIDQSDNYPLNVFNRIQDIINKNVIIKYYNINIKNAAAARNHGIKIAKSDILLFLDDDIQAYPDLCLKHYLNYIQPNNFDGVAGMMLDNNHTINENLPKQYFYPHVGWMYRPLNYSKRIETIDLPTCNCSIKRNIAISLGGFDENLITKEDTDFSYRVFKYGAKVIYDPEAKLIHLASTCGSARFVYKPIDEYIIHNKYLWADHFYLIIKNFGLISGRQFLLPRLRSSILRKIFIFKPHKIYFVIKEIISGYMIANNRVHSGPKYLK